MSPPARHELFHTRETSSQSGSHRTNINFIKFSYYGYPERIYGTTLYENKVIRNYTQEQLIGIVKWAQNYLGTDPNKCYINSICQSILQSAALQEYHTEGIPPFVLVCRRIILSPHWEQ